MGEENQSPKQKALTLSTLSRPVFGVCGSRTVFGVFGARPAFGVFGVRSAFGAFGSQTGQVGRHSVAQ